MDDFTDWILQRPWAVRTFALLVLITSPVGYTVALWVRHWDDLCEGWMECIESIRTGK